MNIIFKYDIDKDVLNLIKGIKSVNNKTPTKLTLLFQEEFGIGGINESDVKKFIEEYIHKNSINIEEKISELQNRWDSIEEESLLRLERMFKIQHPLEEIIAYLTTNERCTYNTKEGYFFVNINNLESNRTVLHELFHFYTWYSVREDMLKTGATETQYNDVKESLTVLLNIEFRDLLDEAVDRGYPQHQEMRKKIENLWKTEKDIKKLVLSLV